MNIRLQKLGGGRFRLKGELNFTTVPAVWRAGMVAFAEADKIELDLQGIQRSDSAGLALLIEWQRQAKQAGKPVTYLNMPAQMLAIARASSLDQILPLSRA